MGLVNPARSRAGSSGGALCRLNFRSSSLILMLRTTVRWRRRFSICCAVRSRAISSARRLDSLSSRGEKEDMCGMTVVLICSFGLQGEGGMRGLGA